MADIILKNSNFVNSKFSVSYGLRKQAVFTIVDEEFAGLNTFGQINRVTCLVSQFDTSGLVISASLASLVIGLGDANVGAKSSDPALRGALLSKDNMEQCIITLYE